MVNIDDFYEQRKKQLDDQLKEQIRIRDDLVKKISEKEPEFFQPKDIDKEIKKQAANDDHDDRINDRILKKEWSEKILKGLFYYGVANFALLLFYGLGWLRFADTGVIKIFLGGNVAAVPTIAIFITRSLFPTKK